MNMNVVDNVAQKSDNYKKYIWILSKGERMENKNITISDVANALGVSKTTVSRAISGKGRIGESTRQRVLDYIQKYDYQPNVIAKSLAQSKTFNICVVMPGNYALVDLPFFQRAIMGIQEIAGIMQYDIVLCISSGNDISGLKRIIQNRKVDGVILLRTMVNDPQIAFLKEKKVPFVATGTTEIENVKQIDHDHKAACKELTSILLMRGLDKIAFLGGDENIVANKTRIEGVLEAYYQYGKSLEKDNIFLNLESRAFVDKAVDDALEKKADCIVCLDDAICAHALLALKEKQISIPKQIRVASFYSSSILENNIPSITSLSFDATELGMKACKNLLSQIDGEKTEDKTLLSYEVVLKESTK